MERNNKTIIWEGFAIIQFSESTIATMDPPSKKRASVKFSFTITDRRSFEIYDHREQSYVSSKVYGENKKILKIDINRRAKVTVKKRDNGTEYIVIGDVADNIPITYALREILKKEEKNSEWSSLPNRENMVLSIGNFRT